MSLRPLAIASKRRKHTATGLRRNPTGRALVPGRALDRSSSIPAELPKVSPRLAPALLEWFAKEARDLPWRHTLDPYAIWISEIMLQQTQVKTVIPYWERWLGALPSVQALAKAKPERVLKLWEGLGYYTRARNLQKAAQQIVRDHRGKFPTLFDDVLALPGVGRYTAGAISSIAFNQPSPILDGNVIRVLARLFGIDTDPRSRQTNADLWQLATALVRLAVGLKPPPLALHFKIAGSCSLLNQSLMELGATICTPKRPGCERCPVKNHCSAFRTGEVDSLPCLAPRPTATPRRFLALIVQHKSRWLVRQRPAGVVNASLWEFPNMEITGETRDITGLASEVLNNIAPKAWQPFGTVRHSITRYRITVDAYHANVEAFGSRATTGDEWLPLSKLEQLAFTSAHRKLLVRLHQMQG